jgi:hypothetical protein
LQVNFTYLSLDRTGQSLLQLVTDRTDGRGGEGGRKIAREWLDEKCSYPLNAGRMKRIEHRSIKKLQLATLTLPLVALFSLTSCGGPSVPKADLMNALKKSIPDGLELTDVSYEVAPTQNGQNSAMMHVKAKITATATQDLYSKPTDPADIKSINDYINFYNGYVLWTNALQLTSYADELNRDKPSDS